MGNGDGQTYTRPVEDAVEENAQAVTTPVDQAVTQSAQALGDLARPPQSEPTRTDIHKVSPSPPFIKQPNSMVCWATALAVMVGWARRHKLRDITDSYTLDILTTIDALTDSSRDKWAVFYQDGQGLSTLETVCNDVNIAAAQLGLGSLRMAQIANRKTPTAQAWSLARQTIVGNRPVLWSMPLTHALVVWGHFNEIDSDGIPQRRYLIITSDDILIEEPYLLEPYQGEFYTWIDA